MSGFRPTQDWKLMGQDLSGTRTYTPTDPYRYETVVVGKRITPTPTTRRRWDEPWKPRPPDQRQIDMGKRIVERHAQDAGRQQAEQARARERADQEARERADQEAREHQSEAERARQRERLARQSLTQVQRQRARQQVDAML